MYKIEVDSKMWTIQELVEMYRNGELSMDIPIQRGIVWDNAARSLYIHSVLLGILAVQPPFVFSRRISHREDDSVRSNYSVLDGKQRLTTLFDFINEEFKLSDLSKQPDIEGVPLTGKKYTELPANFIQQILNTNITCTVVTDPTAEQEDVIFSRLNNNKSMSPIDKIRPQCKATLTIIDFINNHTALFRAMFSSKQLLKKPEFEIVIKMLMMLDNEQGLSSAQMLKFARELPSEPDLSVLNRVCERALNLNNKLEAKEPKIASFLKHKAVFLAFVPYLKDTSLTDKKLCTAIEKALITHLDEFRTGSAHSPTAATVQARKQIVESCL